MRNHWLMAGGVLSAAAALLHLAVIAGGPSWYRFFGAGEAMAQAAARGSWHPPALTALIALVLAVWAAYAFSGAGLIRRLPLLRAGLIVITAIYLGRGLLLIPALALRPDLVDPFALWSSVIVTVYGVAYGVGTWRAWPELREPAAVSAA